MAVLLGDTLQGILQEVDQLVLDIARELNPFGILTPDYTKKVLLEARV